MKPTTQRALLAAVPVVGAAVFHAASTRLETDPLIEGAVLVGITIAATMVAAVLSAGLSMWNRLVGFLTVAWFIITMIWFWGFFLTDVGLPRLITTGERDAMFGWLAVAWVAWVGAEVVLWFRRRRARRGENETGHDEETETDEVAGPSQKPGTVPVARRVPVNWGGALEAGYEDEPCTEPVGCGELGRTVQLSPGGNDRYAAVDDYLSRPETTSAADDDVLGRITETWPEERQDEKSAHHVMDMAHLLGVSPDEVKAALASVGIVPEVIKARSLTSGASTSRAGVRWGDFVAATGHGGTEPGLVREDGRWRRVATGSPQGSPR